MNALNPYSPHGAAVECGSSVAGEKGSDLSVSASCRSHSNSSAHSTASSSSITSTGERKDDKYSFATFCEAEEREISNLRRSICESVERAVDYELKKVGPTIVKRELPIAHSPVIGSSSCAAAVAASSFSSSKLATAEDNLEEESDLTNKARLINFVSDSINRIGAGIGRERARIHATAVRQHRRWLLASQGLGGGLSQRSAGVLGMGASSANVLRSARFASQTSTSLTSAPTAKSLAKAALNAKKRLNESSEFVESVATAMSVKSILRGKNDSHDYVTSLASLAALRALDTVFERTVGFRFLRTEYEDGNDRSNDKREKTEMRKTTSTLLTAKYRVGGRVTVFQSPSSEKSVRSSALLRTAITKMRIAQNKSSALASLAPLLSVTELSRILSSSSFSAQPNESPQTPTRKEDAHPTFAPFSAFVFGKELFLQYRQEYEVKVTRKLAVLERAVAKKVKANQRHGEESMSSPSSSKSEMKKLDEVIDDAVCSVKDCLLRLVSSVILLTHASNTVIDVSPPSEGSTHFDVNSALTETVSEGNSAHCGDSKGAHANDAFEEIGTTEPMCSSDRQALNAKPSHLTPFPKPMYAGDTFYFLGCAMKALTDLSVVLFRGNSSNSEKGIIDILRKLDTCNPISTSTSKPVSAEDDDEWTFFKALIDEWLVYQCPAATVGLANRCLDRYEEQEDRAEKKKQQQQQQVQASSDAEHPDDGYDLERFGVREEDAAEEEEGSLTFPSFVEIRDESDDFFISLSPLLCAMQALSLNEGNHGGAWQLFAECIGSSECYEIGDPKKKNLPMVTSPPFASAAGGSSSLFLQGGSLASTLAMRMLSCHSHSSPAPVSSAASAWEGAIYLGEHTKASAYVEAIRCAGGVVGSSAQRQHLVNLWLPLAQSMFYSSNPDLGAEEVLVACYEDTWFMEEAAEVCKLDKKQILEHIIASDRIACPQAYVELGNLAAIGYVYSERSCKHLKSADAGASFSENNDDDDEDILAEGSVKASDPDAKKKLTVEAKAAYRAARDTTLDSLNELVKEVISSATDLLASVTTPNKMCDEESLREPEQKQKQVRAEAKRKEIMSSSARQFYYKQLAVKYLAKNAEQEEEEEEADCTSTFDGQNNRMGHPDLTGNEKFEIAKRFVSQKLSVVREQSLVISFEPIVGDKHKTKNNDNDDGGDVSGVNSNATLSGIVLPSSATTTATVLVNAGERSNKDGNKQVPFMSTGAPLPPPLTLRKLDCFALALSLNPSDSKAWVQLALGMEDKPMCLAREKLSLVEASAQIAARFLIVRREKERFFYSPVKEDTQDDEDPSKKRQQKRRQQWSAVVFPQLLLRMDLCAAPSEDALTRSQLLATAAAPSQFTSYVSSVLQCDPMVYSRDVLGLSDASPHTTADGSVTRVEALMRALRCNAKDGRTWFILGTTLGEREFLVKKTLAEQKEAEEIIHQPQHRYPSMPIPTSNVFFASEFANQKVKICERISVSIRLPKKLLEAPPTYSYLSSISMGNIGSNSKELGQIEGEEGSEEGGGDVRDDEFVHVTAADCLRMSLKIANGCENPATAKSIRSSVAQWCKKNGFGL